MALVPLLGGAYQNRSVISGAQRCVNLYPEINPADSQAPVPVVHYPTPGLELLASAPVSGFSRCVYRAHNGDLYRVVGTNVYYVDDTWAHTFVGSVANLSTMVSMADNGVAILMVDGSTTGYAIELATRDFGTVTGGDFLGGDQVTFLDGYFALNVPDTSQWYISLYNCSYADLVGTAAFDPLDIATKSGYPDHIVSIIADKGDIWLVGALTSEVWYNSGAADFTYARIPSAMIERGTAAAFSVAKQGPTLQWLHRDREGHCMAVMNDGYDVKRISTHAIEAEWQSYSTVSDAIGFCFQQIGHIFYVLSFPTADKTWAVDMTTGQWFEWAWLDDNGNLRRHRCNGAAFAYETNVGTDWQTGDLYRISSSVYTDNERPITRLRTFPHILNDGKMVGHKSLIAYMQVGTIEGHLADDPPYAWLRWSDDWGASYGEAVQQSIGSTGQFLTSPMWRNLGGARDRVYELSWSSALKTALNGAFIETEAWKD